MTGLELVVKYRAYVKHSDASGLYVSYCPLLDIMSQGRDEAEARVALDDSVRMFVEYCWRRGDLQDVLRRRGLVERPSSHDGPSTADDSGEHISVRKIEIESEWWNGEVPLGMIADDQNRKARGLPCKQ